MPDPIPVMLMGRLAVDKSQQGSGLGRAWQSAIDPPRGFVHNPARGIEGHSHICYQESKRLVMADWFPERFALLSVFC